jgi:hypothetical protein
MAAAALLGGCGLGARIAPDRLSLADRCADIMARAMPFADIEIVKRSSEGTGIRTIAAQVEGTRTDLAKDAPGDRDLAAECQFDDSVLTGFRWTKGGPPPAP